MKDAKEWAEVCKSDIENLAKECDCPKCRAEKEAEIAKSEPEVKPEEPKPAWTPEVGMLIQSEQYGVWEITGIIDGGVKLVSIASGSKGFLPDVHLRNCTPIAELEGLEEGDDVYSVDEEGFVNLWKITYKSDRTDRFVVEMEHEETDIKIHVSGGVVGIGNGKQMFWRTKGRAERFGK